MAIPTWTLEEEEFNPFGGDGGTARQVFSIVAPNVVEAARRLATEVNGSGVRQGTAYRDRSGRVPDRTVVCRSARLTMRSRPPADGSGLYRATVSYAVVDGDAFDQNNDAAPPPPEYRWLEERIESPVDLDAKGKPILNSAGTPFNPPATNAASVWVLEVKWHRPRLRIVERMKYANAVNEDAFEVTNEGRVEAHMGWMRSLRQEPTDGALWVVTAQILVMPLLEVDGKKVSAHDHVLIDRGYYKKVNSSGANPSGLERIKVRGEVAAEPQLLDGNGGVLESGKQAVRLVFGKKRRANFSELLP